MRKYLSFLLLTVLLYSCNNENEPQATDKTIPESTLTKLNYPDSIGSSGDTITSILGYGYDATGFCDSVSVRAKVLDMSLINYVLSHPNSAFSTLVSSNSLSGLVSRISFINDLDQQTTSGISSHFKSLLKLANNTDSIDPKYSVAYYSCNAIYSHFYYYCTIDEFQKALSKDFKNDLISLSAQELVSKYGTHILTNIFLGKKFEVLYRYESSSPIDAEHGLYKRLKQFCGGVSGCYISDYEKSLPNSNEQMIYNTIGLNPKQCGVVKTTDNNPNKLVINIYPTFGTDMNCQFLEIGKNGLTPLSDLISDPIKKQEVKHYIETYIAGKSVEMN